MILERGVKINHSTFGAGSISFVDTIKNQIDVDFKECGSKRLSIEVAAQFITIGDKSLTILLKETEKEPELTHAEETKKAVMEWRKTKDTKKEVKKESYTEAKIGDAIAPRVQLPEKEQKEKE